MTASTSDWVNREGLPCGAVCAAQTWHATDLPADVGRDTLARARSPRELREAWRNRILMCVHGTDPPPRLRFDRPRNDEITFTQRSKQGRLSAPAEQADGRSAPADVAGGSDAEGSGAPLHVPVLRGRLTPPRPAAAAGRKKMRVSPRTAQLRTTSVGRRAWGRRGVPPLRLPRRRPTAYARHPPPRPRCPRTCGVGGGGGSPGRVGRRHPPGRPGG